ncbi:hypothetical protein ACFYXW_12580 [Streptomyces sp. NPDC001981]
MPIDRPWPLPTEHAALTDPRRAHPSPRSTVFTVPAAMPGMEREYD